MSTDAPIMPATVAVRERNGRATGCRAWLAWTLAALVFANAFYYGVQFRKWVWHSTTPVRFVNSVSNAIEWGSYANEVGVLNVYEGLLEKHGPEGDYEGPARFALDYPPLRLLIASWWAGWAQEQFPPPSGKKLTWRPEYEFTQPMLRGNTAAELAAAMGMFFLVYRWVRLSKVEPTRRPWWKWIPRDNFGDSESVAAARRLPSVVGLRHATLAALLMWFCPAVIFNAHVYPQWDAYLLPAFVWAVYLGLRNWFFPAGILVGICAMAKGQILIGLPVLIAWPLLRANLGGVVRLLAGVATGVGAIVWPWMLRAEGTLDWFSYIAVGAGCLVPASLLPRRWSWGWLTPRIVLALAGATLISWPILQMAGPWRLAVMGLSAMVAALAFFARRSWLPATLGILGAGAVALTVPLFQASLAWYEIGIAYGTRHWRRLFWCHGANLGAILQARFKWAYKDVIDLSWVPMLELGEVPIRSLMMALYVAALVPLVIALVRHHRNHDVRLFAVVAAPLMMSYTLLPQMIERYLIWPAALLSAFAAVSVGGFLLWLCLSVLACVLMFGYMLIFITKTPAGKFWLPAIGPTFPDVSWAILVLAGVMLYIACCSSPKRETQLLK